MTGHHLDDLAAEIDDTDIPAPPPLADIRHRAQRRTSRRHAVAGAAMVLVLVAVIAGAGVLKQNDPELTTAAPPGTEIEKFDRVPDGVGTWEFRSTPAIVSRTGEESGFGLRRVTGADDLLIYLTDGGICVDAQSCAGAAGSFDATELEAAFVGTDGGPVRSLIGAGAPFAGWNVVVVPGITGDFHGGTESGVQIPGGPSDQHLVGAENLSVVLDEVFASDDVRHERVVVAGSGSAGLGALITVADVADVAEAAGASLQGVIVDGGALPRLNGQLPDCVVQRWATLGGLAYPSDWEDFVDADAEPTNLSGLYRYAAARYPEVDFVLTTRRDDPEMRRLLRFGAGACEKPLGDNSPAAFMRGIALLEADLDTIDGWSHVLVDGSGPPPIASADDLESLPDLDALLRALAEPS